MTVAIDNPPSPLSLARDAEAYWTRSADNRWIRDMSHWRSTGRWTDDAVWTAIGKEHLEMFRNFARQIDHHVSVERMLEWGPGGGTNALAFSKHVKTIYGVDISAANLAECGRQLQAGGFKDWRPIQIEAADPAQVRRHVDGPLDFILCTAVFQHFPSQQYGRDVLKIMHDLLAPGGLAIVQTRYDDGSEQLRCKDRDYQNNVVTFTSYRIHDFWQTAADIGLTPAAVFLKPAVNYAYYSLRKG